MADSAVAVTAGSGTNIDTRTEGTNGNHRQVVVLGDPATFLSLGTEVEVGGGEPPATAIKDLIGGFIPYPR